MMMANGTNANFDLIKCITIDTDTQYVIINTDEFGNPFTLNGFLIGILSVGASDASSEGALKIAINSNLHYVNRVIDHATAIRRANSKATLAVYGQYIPGIGHFVIDTKQDSANAIDSKGDFINSLYNTGANQSNNAIGFSNQPDITSFFIGTDNASLKLGSGSIIVVYGHRK